VAAITRYRIPLTVMVTDREIIIIDIGSHDAVYRYRELWGQGFTGTLLPP